MEVEFNSLDMDQILFSNISKDLEELILGMLKCDNCSRITLQPYVNDDETKFFCKSCSDQLKEICRPKSFSILEKKVLDNIRVICKHKKNGCNVEFFYSESIYGLQNHEIICEYRISKCRYCNFTTLVKDIENHESSCQNKTVKCNFCGSNCEISFSDDKGKCIINLRKKVEECNNHISILYKKIEELEKKARWNKRKLKIKKKGRKDLINTNSNQEKKLDEDYEYLQKQGNENLKNFNYALALENFEKALKVMLTKYNEDSCHLKKIYLNIGDTYKELCKFESSLLIFHKLLKIIEEENKDSNEYADILNHIGEIYLTLNDFGNSFKYLDLSFQKRISLPNNVENIAMSYLSLGIYSNEKGEYNKALKTLDKGIEILQNKKCLVLGLIFDEYGETMMQLGETAKAKGFYLDSLKIKKEIEGENRPYIAKSYENLSMYFCAQRKFEQSIEYIKEAIKIMKTLEDKKGLSTCYYNRGYIFMQKEQYLKAKRSFNKSLKIRKEIFGENHTEVAKIYTQFGLINEEENNLKKSIKFHNASIKIFTNIFGELHSEIANEWFNIGSVYTSRNEYKLGLDFYLKALKIRKLLYTQHPAIAETYDSIGILYNNLQDYRKAFEKHKEALSIRTKIYGENHIEVALSLSNIAMSNIELSNRCENFTIHYLEKALNIRKNAYGDNCKEVAECHYNLGYCWLNLKKFNEAKKEFENAKKIAIRIKDELMEKNCNDYLEISDEKKKS